MAAVALTELVKARVDRGTKAALALEMQRTQRSEAAIVRLALNAYLTDRLRART